MARPRTIVERAFAVRVVVIHPNDSTQAVTIRTAYLPTLFYADPRHGLQVAPGALEEILGSRWLITQWVDGSDWLITARGGAGTVWWLRGLGPRRGPGVLIGWDQQADAVDDARLSTEAVADWIELEPVDKPNEREEIRAHAS